MKSLQISKLQHSWGLNFSSFWQSYSTSLAKDFANVDKCIWLFWAISIRWSKITLWISLNLFKFNLAFCKIESNISFVSFTFNSYSYCYFSISFILLNRFTFLSIVASTESWEKTCRVSSYSILFFSLSFLVLTFSRIYFLAQSSLCKTF